MSPANKPLYVTVVTPDGPVRLKGKEEDDKAILLNQPATRVILPLFDGYMGVESLHTSTIAKLGFGILEIQNANQKMAIYLDGGVVQIKNNHISVLASSARTVRQLNKTQLEQELEKSGSSKSLAAQIHKEKLRMQLRLLAQSTSK
ncbi:MAG: F0F1 ATP synthase subunit epsilon [Planctomycetota bacterium]